MKLFENDMKRFIEENRGAEVVKLRLKYAGAGEDVAEAINQIDLSKKAPMKFIDPSSGGDMRPRWLPSAVAVEQSSSLAMARFHASLMAGRKSILDMTMGMGIDASVIATANPQARVTAVEQSERLCEFARVNYADIANLQIVNGDSMAYLNSHAGAFDAIFVDPARRDTQGDRVFSIADCTPDISNLPSDPAAPAYIVAKLSPMLDVTDTLRRLPLATDIYVVEERGECREITVVINKSADESEHLSPTVHALDLTSQLDFTFTPAEEAAAEISFANPRKGWMLYEPSAAVMKTGAFRTLSQRFGLAAIAPNTHLYVGPEAVDGFPGRGYVIEEVLPYSSSNIKKIAKSGMAASVSTRNFVTDAATLRRRLRTRESATTRLIGITDSANCPYMLIVKSR